MIGRRRQDTNCCLRKCHLFLDGFQKQREHTIKLNIKDLTRYSTAWFLSTHGKHFIDYIVLKNFLPNGNYCLSTVLLLQWAVTKDLVRFLDCLLDLEFLYSFVHKNKALVPSFFLGLLLLRLRSVSTAQDLCFLSHDT